MKNMKKIIVISVIGLFLFALPAFTSSKNTKTSTIENGDCKYGQCSKIKADGYRCKNCAQKDSEYCWSHRN